MKDTQIKDFLIEELEEKLFCHDDEMTPFHKILNRVHIDVVYGSNKTYLNYHNPEQNMTIKKTYDNLTKKEIAENVFEECILPGSILEKEYSPYLKVLLIMLGYFYEKEVHDAHYSIVLDMMGRGLSDYAIELRNKFYEMYPEERK